MYYSPDELNENAKNVSLKQIQSFSDVIFKDTFIEGLVFGDYTKEEAEKSFEILKKGLKTSPISKESSFQVRYLNQLDPEKIQAIRKLKI